MKQRLNIAIEKGFADLNSLMPKINKCLFSKHDLIAIVPASTVAGELQIKSAVEKAFRAFASGNAISKKIFLEFLLYLYATPQIDEALKLASKRDRTYLAVFASLHGNLPKIAKCVHELGFRKKELAIKPNPKKLSRIYKNASKLAGGDIKKLELAIIEEQSMLQLKEH